MPASFVEGSMPALRSANRSMFYTSAQSDHLPRHGAVLACTAFASVLVDSPARCVAAA